MASSLRLAASLGSVLLLLASGCHPPGPSEEGPDSGVPSLDAGEEPDAGEESTPDTALTAGPAGTVSSVSAQFEFTSSETASTFECRLDAEAFVPCTSPHVYPSVTEGTHSFAVRAVLEGRAD